MEAQNYIKLIDKQNKKFISYFYIKLDEIEIFNKNMDKFYKYKKLNGGTKRIYLKFFFNYRGDI